MLKNLSIQTKLFSFIFAVSIISLVVFVYYVRQTMEENYQLTETTFINSTLDFFIIGLENTMFHSDDRDLESMMVVVAENRHVGDIRIVNSNGTIRHSTDTSEISKNLLVVEPNFDYKTLPFESNQLLFHRGSTNLGVIQPIESKPACRKCHGAENTIAYLAFDLNLTEARQTLQNLYAKIAILGILSIIAFFSVLYYLIQRLIVKRLANINNAISEIENGNMNYRISSKNRDEIGNIKIHFNDMVEQIQSSQSRIEEMHFEQLRQVDKLATLGELTAGLAHEMNNYSGILHSRLEYLKEVFSNKFDMNEYSEDMESMIEQVEKMSVVTRNILRHSKLNSEELTAHPLRRLIEDSMKLFSQTLNKRKIKLKINLPEKDILIKCDPSQIEQIFVNLTANSIDALSFGGEIKITAERQNSTVRIIFADNGPGIDKNNIENIFMPFFTTKPSGKGSGLGLYIVSNILKAHQGSIEYSQAELTGTQFEIKLKTL